MPGAVYGPGGKKLRRRNRVVKQDGSDLKIGFLIGIGLGAIAALIYVMFFW
jgi:hypothetical protein